MDIIRAFNEHQACELLHRNPSLIPLAGGTDLIPELNRVPNQDCRLLDLSEIKEWKGVKENSQFYVIGALTTFSEIESAGNNEPVSTDLHILVEACSRIGGPQIRNRGTLAGNIQSASPAADAVTALLALDAKVHLVSLDAKRVLPLDQYYSGYRKTVKKREELIRSIWIPKGSRYQVYRKIGNRNALSVSVVSLAMLVREGGVRIVFGSVAPTPLLALNTMALINAFPGIPDEEAVREKLALDLFCISDCRSSLEYRQEVAFRLLMDGLRKWRGEVK